MLASCIVVWDSSTMPLVLLGLLRCLVDSRESKGRLELTPVRNGSRCDLLKCFVRGILFRDGTTHQVEPLRLNLVVRLILYLERDIPISVALSVLGRVEVLEILVAHCQHVGLRCVLPLLLRLVWIMSLENRALLETANLRRPVRACQRVSCDLH